MRSTIIDNLPIIYCDVKVNIWDRNMYPSEQLLPGDTKKGTQLQSNVTQSKD